MFYTYNLSLIVGVFFPNGGIKKVEIELHWILVLCKTSSVCIILLNKGARANSLDVR